VIGNAVRVMQIATGEVEDDRRDPAKQLAREGGLIGGPKRAAKLSKKRRTEIASNAAQARWQAEKSAGETRVTIMVSKSRKAGASAPKNRSRKT
jgi:hypothetical protein